QPVVVENKPGGATITGTQFVVKAAPDGHTLLIGTANLATNAALFGQLPYDASRDLAPVSLLVRVPVFAFAHAGANIASLNDLVAQSHGTPGGLSYATAGNGSAPHLAGELFRLESKSRIAHIPYNGSAQAAAALVGGQVPLSFDNLSPLLAHVKTGAVVPLAIAMPERSGIAPEVPTFKELGYPMQAYSWWGVLAPAGTPPAIVERLNQEIRKALQMPQIRDKLHAQGMQAVGSSAAEFAAHIRAETDKWRRVVTDARIQTQ
ncbi:tripartite tricarboxylate transporter substrate binding protein, partial [Verminephrobacter sp. Larva24]